MKMLAAVLALAVLAAGPAGAQPPAPACVKPAAPVFPAPAAASALLPGEMAQHRATRDAYFTAADRNLDCLNTSIEARMRTLFATGGAMDPTLRAEGLAHEQASRERAGVHEQYLRLCLAWQDANGAAAIAC